MMLIAPSCGSTDRGNTDINTILSICLWHDKLHSCHKCYLSVSFFSVGAGIYTLAMFGTSANKYFGIHDPMPPEDAASFGYGFYLGIVGCCFSFMVMLLSAMEAIHAVDLLQNMQNRLTVWTTPYTLFVDQEA